MTAEEAKNYGMIDQVLNRASGATTEIKTITDNTEDGKENM